ncbi:MAG: hypothetical protein R3B82_26680 [Sandaracinaceae bacterium]
MQHTPPSEPTTLAARLLAWIRPTRVYLTEDGASVLAERIATQFEDELETRKLKAVRV